jgi:type VI secretion system secreted protein Hcp
VPYNPLHAATLLIEHADQSPRRTAMAYQFYLELQFKSQGKVKGQSTTKGHSSTVSKGLQCHAFEYSVAAQYDAKAGQTPGKRTHTPLVITREVDSASPLLFHACVTNEVLQSAKLSFVKPDSGGKEVVFHTIELTNGTISKIGYASPHNGNRPQAATKGNRLQAITFVYEEIAVDGAKNVPIPYSLLG